MASSCENAWPTLASLKDSGRWGHVLAASASPTAVGPEQKNWMRRPLALTTVHGGQYDTKYVAFE